MNINETIDYMLRDIQRQAKKLATYRELEVIFAGVQFPEGIHTYVYDPSYSENDSEISIEFSSTGENKDIRPLVHQITRKLHAKFAKAKSYDGETLEYKTEVTIPTDFNRYRGDKKLSIKISGVVPASCRVEETEVPLTPEEIAEAHDNVRTTRIVRKLICGPSKSEEKPSDASNEAAAN